MLGGPDLALDILPWLIDWRLFKVVVVVAVVVSGVLVGGAYGFCCDSLVLGLGFGLGLSLGRCGGPGSCRACLSRGGFLWRWSVFLVTGRSFLVRGARMFLALCGSGLKNIKIN